jgi:hypothetical protein
MDAVDSVPHKQSLVFDLEHIDLDPDPGEDASSDDRGAKTLFNRDDFLTDKGDDETIDRGDHPLTDKGDNLSTDRGDDLGDNLSTNQGDDLPNPPSLSNVQTARRTL